MKKWSSEKKVVEKGANLTGLLMKLPHCCLSPSLPLSAGGVKKWFVWVFLVLNAKLVFKASFSSFQYEGCQCSSFESVGRKAMS